jgi:hypothetical protein
VPLLFRLHEILQDSAEGGSKTMQPVIGNEGSKLGNYIEIQLSSISDHSILRTRRYITK